MSGSWRSSQRIWKLFLAPGSTSLPGLVLVTMKRWNSYGRNIRYVKHIVMRIPSFVVKLWFWSEELACLSRFLPLSMVLKLVHISPEPGEKRLWKCHLPFINFIIVWALWHAQKWKLSSCKVDSLPSEGVTRFLFQKDKYRWSKLWSCLFCKFQE